MELAPGASVTADLTLVRPLSSGAMGSLWVARTGHGHEVAIKFVLAKMARDRATRLRFSREAEAASQIDHPNVVRIYDHGAAHDGTPFITMELLEGEGLGDKLERERRVTSFDAAAILRQAGNALDAAHARGIIHRDIKPDNLFLVQGRTSKLKVLDFGMAKQLRPTAGAKTADEVTATGVAVGTPDYMSPEQVLGAKDVDLRSDLWALGVVIYRSLTGRLPFKGTNPHALFFNICKGKYPPLVQQGVSSAFDPWFRLALAPNKNKRFGSAREMVVRFEGILREQSDVLTGDESTQVFSLRALEATSGGLDETHHGIDTASTQSIVTQDPHRLDDDDGEDFATLAIDPEAARRALAEAGFDPTKSTALPLVTPVGREQMQSLSEHHAHRAPLEHAIPPTARDELSSASELRAAVASPPVRAPLPSWQVRAPLPSSPASGPQHSSRRSEEPPPSRRTPLPSMVSMSSEVAPRARDRGLWKVALAAGVLASGVAAVFVLRSNDPGSETDTADEPTPKVVASDPSAAVGDDAPRAKRPEVVPPPTEPASSLEPLPQPVSKPRSNPSLPRPQLKPSPRPAPVSKPRPELVDAPKSPEAPEPTPPLETVPDAPSPASQSPAPARDSPSPAPEPAPIPEAPVVEDPEF